MDKTLKEYYNTYVTKNGITAWNRPSFNYNQPAAQPFRPTKLKRSSEWYRRKALPARIPSTYEIKESTEEDTPRDDLMYEVPDFSDPTIDFGDGFHEFLEERRKIKEKMLADALAFYCDTVINDEKDSAIQAVADEICDRLSTSELNIKSTLVIEDNMPTYDITLGYTTTMSEDVPASDITLKIPNLDKTPDDLPGLTGSNDDGAGSFTTINKTMAVQHNVHIPVQLAEESLLISRNNKGKLTTIPHTPILDLNFKHTRRTVKHTIFCDHKLVFQLVADREPDFQDILHKAVLDAGCRCFYFPTPNVKTAVYNSHLQYSPFRSCNDEHALLYRQQFKRYLYYEKEKCIKKSYSLRTFRLRTYLLASLWKKKLEDLLSLLHLLHTKEQEISSYQNYIIVN